MNLGEKMSLPQIILLVYVFCVVVILPAATRQAIRDYKAKRARTSTSEPKVSQHDVLGNLDSLQAAAVPSPDGSAWTAAYAVLPTQAPIEPERSKQ